MTVISVRKQKDHIELCADSQLSQWVWWKMTDESNNSIMKDFSKIVQENGVTLWWTWLVEQILFLKHFLKTNIPEGSRISDIENYFLKFYEERKKKDENFEPENAYLFIFEGKIFHINCYYIYEVEERDSIGSWMFYARAALYLWKSAKEACEVAKELARWVWWKIEKVKVPLT